MRKHSHTLVHSLICVWLLMFSRCWKRRSIAIIFQLQPSTVPTQNIFVPLTTWSRIITRNVVCNMNCHHGRPFSFSFDNSKERVLLTTFLVDDLILCETHDRSHSMWLPRQHEMVMPSLVGCHAPMPSKQMDFTVCLY